VAEIVTGYSDPTELSDDTAEVWKHHVGETFDENRPADEPFIPKRFLIVGCGYLGVRVASNLDENGHLITAVTRSPEKAALMADGGYTPIIGDVLDPTTLAALPSADALLIALTHDPTSGVSKRAVLVNGVANLVREMCTRVGHVVYISSTSVYGQSDGSWVDETSLTEPTSEGGQITLEAERALQEICSAPGSTCRLTILRLAGIYGPGRLIARVDQLRAGTPVAGSPEAWLNLIHADDAAFIVSEVAEGLTTSPILLVCDDRPVTRGEFYSAMAKEIGAPPPTFDPDSSEGRRTSGLNKRCSNARLHAELDLELRCPDAVEGLPQFIYFERAFGRL
jgi:nucleoside-diphosphate-sugar epimerase